MSDTALRDELMTLLIAGQETSAIVLAWTTALLAHHPGHQVAAAEEVSAILQGSQPNAENIKYVPSLARPLPSYVLLWQGHPHVATYGPL